MIYRHLATFGLLAGMPLFAASGTLAVHYPQDSRLKVVWGDDARAVIDQIAARKPDLSVANAFGIVVSNASNVAIVGLTMRWKWTDSVGKARIHDVRSDSLFLTKAQVVGPHEQVLILPGALVRHFNSGVGISGLSVQHTLRQFDAASDVAAFIDCVLFADGTVLGPDESGSLEGMKARRRVANEIGGVVLSNAARGKQGIVAALNEYAQKAVGHGSPSEQSWRNTILHTVAAYKGDMTSLAHSLIELPNVPVKQ